MGTTSQKLQHILDTKQAISGAIAARGVDVPIEFAGYSDAIQSIPSGYSTDLVRGIVESTATDLPTDLQNSFVAIGDYKFFGMSTLSGAMDLPHVASVGACSFQNTKIPRFSAPLCTTLSNSCFEGCNALTAVSAPMVEAIPARAFYDCYKLFDTPLFGSVQSIGDYAFYDTRFKDMGNLSAAETLGVYAFSRSWISAVNMPNLTAVPDNAWEETQYLTTSASFAVATSIGNYAFYDSYYLKGVDAPSALTVGQHAFHNAAVAYVNFPSLQSTSNYAFENTGLREIPSGAFPSLTSTANYTFATNRNLSAVELPSLQSVGSWCFRNCANLETVSLPAATTLNTYCFQGCTKLSSLYIPSVTTINTRALENCSSLTSLSLPSINSIATRVFGYSAAQIYTTNLTDLYIPNKTESAVRSMANYATWYLPHTCLIHASDNSWYY